MTKEKLQQTMDGYCLDEPYFTSKLKENVSTLMKALKDPALPLLELQVSGTKYDREDEESGSSNSPCIGIELAII